MKGGQNVEKYSKNFNTCADVQVYMDDLSQSMPVNHIYLSELIQRNKMQ